MKIQNQAQHSKMASTPRSLAYLSYLMGRRTYQETVYRYRIGSNREDLNFHDYLDKCHYISRKIWLCLRKHLYVPV